MISKLFTRQLRMPLLPIQMAAFSSQQFTQIFVKHLPSGWDQNEVATRFGVVGPVLKVNLIKNSEGENTGKALISFKDNSTAQQAIDMFNSRKLSDQACSAAPFVHSGEVATMKETSLVSKRVYLLNLPYDAYKWEIENLCKEFVSVQRVVMAQTPQGHSRGYAFVFVENAKEV